MRKGPYLPKRGGRILIGAGWRTSHGIGNINMLHDSVGNMACEVRHADAHGSESRGIRAPELFSPALSRYNPYATLRPTTTSFLTILEMPLCDASYHPDPSSNDVAASTAVLSLMPIAWWRHHVQQHARRVGSSSA